MKSNKVVALTLAIILIAAFTIAYYLLTGETEESATPLVKPVRSWVEVVDGNAKLFIDGKPADLLGFFATTEVREYIDKSAEYNVTFCRVCQCWNRIDKVTIEFFTNNPGMGKIVKQLNKEGRLNELTKRLPAFDVPKNAAELIDFNIIDDLFNYAASKGVRLIYGVILFDPPIWFVRNFPDHMQWNSSGGMAFMPSFSSQKFIEYADQVLTAIVNRYKNHPALLGWALSFGWTNEDNYPGGRYYCSWGLYDYSPVAIESFRQWLRQKYNGSVEALRSSWRNETVTFENAMPPKPLPPPMNTTELIEIYINGPGDNRTQWIDWMEFRLHEKNKCMLHFANLIKSLDPNHVIIQTPGAVIPGVGSLSNIVTMAIDPYVYVNSPVDIVFTNPGLDEEKVTLLKAVGYPPFIRYYELHGKAAFIKWEGRPGVDYDAHPELITYVAEMARRTGSGLAIWGGNIPMPGTWEKQPEFTDEQIRLFIETFRNTPEQSLRKAEVAVIVEPRLCFYLYYKGTPYKLADLGGLLMLLHAIGVECDFIPVEELYDYPDILNNYKIVILDNIFYMTKELTNILVNYRDNGGCLFIIGRTGVYGEYGGKFTHLKALLGVNCEIYDYKALNYSWSFTEANDTLLNGINGYIGDEESPFNLLYIPFFDYESQGYVKLGVLDLNSSIATVIHKGNIVCWFPRLGLQILDRRDRLDNVLKFLKNLCMEFGVVSSGNSVGFDKCSHIYPFCMIHSYSLNTPCTKLGLTIEHEERYCALESFGAWPMINPFNVATVGEFVKVRHIYSESDNSLPFIIKTGGGDS